MSHVLALEDNIKIIIKTLNIIQIQDIPIEFYRKLQKT